VSDDLTTGLRELAEAGQAPPPVSGAEIRRRAGGRKRRRRTVAAVAGASAAAALALTLLLSLGGGGEADQRPAPAASPTGTPSTQAAPDVTVYLGRLVMVTDGRKLPVSPGASRTPTPTGRMTVTAMYDIGQRPAEELGLKGRYYKVPWMIRLRAANGRTTDIAGLVYDEKAPGNYAITAGWIGLRADDAKWLYGHLRPGDVIDIEGTAPTRDDRAVEEKAREKAKAAATRTPVLPATPTATPSVDLTPTPTTGLLGGAVG